LAVEHQRVEDGDDEDHSLAGAWFRLAEQVAALQCGGDGLHLHLARLVELALSNHASDFVLEEEVVPGDAVASSVDLRFYFLLWTVVAELHFFIIADS
jgi:hypothetical protein